MDHGSCLFSGVKFLGVEDHHQWKNLHFDEDEGQIVWGGLFGQQGYHCNVQMFFFGQMVFLMKMKMKAKNYP